MKRFLASILLASYVSLPAFAIMYEGTITLEVTAVSDFDSFHVGDVYQGWYRYESPTVDGTFLFDFYYTQPNRPVEGGITAPFPLGGSLNGIHPNMLMTVSGGDVVDFFFNEQRAGGGINLTESVLTADQDFGPSHGRVSGTASFSAPRAVPDIGLSAGMLLAGLAGLCLFQVCSGVEEKPHVVYHR